MTFLKDFWLLLKPFLSGPQRWLNIAFLAAIFALVVAGVQVSVLLNKWNAAFYNALQDRNIQAFYDQIITWVILFTASLTAGVAQLYLRRTVQLRWRRVLTDRHLADWLRNHAYYRLQWSSPTTDNPDQRIADDLEQFCSDTINLLFDFINAVLKLGAFITILWNISGSFTVGGHVVPGYMLWVALIYALLANWLVHLVGRKLAGLNFTHQRFEADFRYALIRVRENAQGIALYGGEREEQRHLGDRFSQVVHNLREIIRRETFLSAFVSGHAQLNSVISYLVATPHYFAGIITLGTLMQSASAFMQTEVALSWLVRSYRRVAEWKATFDRLRQFRQGMAHIRTEAASFGNQPSDSRELVLEGVNLRLPDGTTLLRDLNLQFPPGSRTLLTGPSGCGKSTLFNTIAGIWPYFEGLVALPRDARVLFLPQRAYLPIASLRRVACYPQAAEKHSDDTIRAALTACGLAPLADQLDVEQNWSQRLSPGEQQRLAFARALLIRPDFLFLDEATSSLDEAAETALYQMLLEELPHAAVVSIAHRHSIGTFHHHRVNLTTQRVGHYQMASA